MAESKSTSDSTGTHVDSTFPHNWEVKILSVPPMIAPARQFVYPRPVPGEEDALARGALQLMVAPRTGGAFLATCALGFADASMPSGVWSCPAADKLCAVAGGYAYIIHADEPAASQQIPLRPVTQVMALPAQGLLLFAGFHHLVALGGDGIAWQSERLSWEGLRVVTVENDTLHGFGWNLMTDKEVVFTVNLRTGQHTGGTAP